MLPQSKEQQRLKDRTAFAVGICVHCACSDANPCEGGCTWVGGDRTICTQCCTWLILREPERSFWEQLFPLGLIPVRSTYPALRRARYSGQAVSGFEIDLRRSPEESAERASFLLASLIGQLAEEILDGILARTIPLLVMQACVEKGFMAYSFEHAAWMLEQYRRIGTVPGATCELMAARRKGET